MVPIVQIGIAEGSGTFDETYVIHIEGAGEFFRFWIRSNAAGRKIRQRLAGCERNGQGPGCIRVGTFVYVQEKPFAVRRPVQGSKELQSTFPVEDHRSTGRLR